MDVKELEKWLNNIQPLEAITSEMYDGLMAQCRDGSPLHGLIGLVLGERQQLMEQLANLPLGSAEKMAVAAVTQGAIKGMDEIRQTLLALAQRAAEKQPAGK